YASPRGTQRCRAASPSKLMAGQRCRALAFKLPAGLLGTTLQFVLEPLLLLLEYFRIGRRAIVGLGKIGQRQNEADRLTGAVDALDDQALALLQLADKLSARLVIGHATVLEADDIRSGHRLALVDDDPRSRLDRHPERKGDPKDLLLLAFGLDDDRRDHRHSGFDSPVLPGEADLLGIGLLTLQAELGPG